MKIIFLLSILIVYVAGDVCNLSSATPHKFSICTMVHNEATYIEEWVAYHLLVKVDHMYIYDDQSTDNIQEILAPYVKQGYVTIIPWDKSKQTVNPEYVAKDPPYTRSQRFALADCVYNHGNETNWIGIWDVDEFVVFNASYSGMPAFIDSIKENLDNYVIPLTVFGSNGHEATPNGMVIENYTWRNNDTRFGFNEKTNKFVGKSMYTSKCAGPEVHFVNVLPAGCKKHYTGWIKADGSSKHMPITLNHYATKSWEHFVEKMRKWNWGVNGVDKSKFLVQDHDYFDDTLVKFAPLIKDLQTCMTQYK